MHNPIKRAELWFKTYVAIGAIAYKFSVQKRKRMSHDNGLVGTGRIKIVDNPQFPENDFLTPGRVFSCRLRHAAVSYPDETALQVFGASLKFADNPALSPFDLEMNTGDVSIFWSARTFMEFAALIGEHDWTTYMPYYEKYSQGYTAAQKNLRWQPESYARLWFHSQTVSQFIARPREPSQKGHLYYARYRLVPENYRTQPETGIAPEERLKYPRAADSSPPEKSQPDRDYLKQEYRERVRHHGPVRYLLQLQLHDPSVDGSPEWCNSNKPWPEETHPWRDVAHVEINKVLSWDEAVITRTNPNQAPASLGFLPAYSLDDYNSLNYMRAKTGFIRETRLLMNRLLGTRPEPRPERVVGVDDPFYG